MATTTHDPPCPTCQRPTPRASTTFPFCSGRCRMADLGAWLDERYRIGGSDEEDVREVPDAGDGNEG